MKPMFLPAVEHAPPQGPYTRTIAELRANGLPVPQIMHLFAYKPDRTTHLSRFTQEVMRGASPLPPGFRELIAAFTSRQNACLF
jgi:alkylhydroperoxidase family enzyme